MKKNILFLSLAATALLLSASCTSKKQHCDAYGAYAYEKATQEEVVTDSQTLIKKEEAL